MGVSDLERRHLMLSDSCIDCVLLRYYEKSDKAKLCWVFARERLCYGREKTQRTSKLAAAIQRRLSGRADDDEGGLKFCQVAALLPISFHF